ncbi:MAG: ribonuclease H-like domain-containing protein, partial [Planctomycetota bacterium]|nr:ribonuclease H-like domain-containing protein [Planctomycetota bacterium]
GAGLPPWLGRRLRREGAGRAADSAAAGDGGEPPSLDAPGGLVVTPTEHGPWCARETVNGGDQLHGDWALDEVFHAAPADAVLLTADQGLAELDLRHALYLDTETTGLSGGAGTTVFMIGLGAFEAGGNFRTWQGFLRGPEEEKALLEEVARRIRAKRGLVSFFGKSFDRHRLEDKMRAVGVEPPFEGRPHLDLYHPLRRLYGAALPDGRLRTMEARLCGFERVGDLPGSEAPAAWLNFLRGRAHRLEGVFRHNLEDVLSLVTLAAHLGRSRAEQRADGRPLSGHGAARAVSLARALVSNGQRAAAISWYERARERLELPSRTLELEYAEALRLLRQPRAEVALREFCTAVDDRLTVPALVSLAKVAEHWHGDRGEAAGLCRRALGLIERHHSGAEGARLTRDLTRRLARCGAD